MRGRQTRARLADVAARAGTTAITVSRALRQPEKVAPDTRARVLRAVEELGYVPDLAASGLAAGSSRIVAVVVPTIANSVFAETVQGLSDAVKASGLQLLLGETGYEVEAERALLRALAGRRPDGLVTVGLVRDAESRTLLQRLGTPVVETWDLAETPLDQVVGFSNEAAGATIRRCFEATGRRRPVFVGGPDERAAARRRGFAAAVYIAIDEPISYGAGRRALQRLLRDHPDADAAFFATDVLAVGALLEAQRLGVAVPERLAVAGLGDLEIAAELGLTTIRVPSYEIGRRAGERLLGRLRGEAPENPVLDLGFELVRRRSA